MTIKEAIKQDAAGKQKLAAFVRQFIKTFPKTEETQIYQGN